MDRRLKPILLIEYPAASQEPTTDPRKIQDPKESELKKRWVDVAVNS